MVCEREFFNTLHGIEINFTQLIIMIWRCAYRFFLWRSTNFCQSYVPLWLRKIQFYVWYMVFEREIFNILHGIEIKLYTINYHDFEICISFFFFCCWQFTNFCQSYVPLWLRKIQFYIGYMVCEREFFNTLHGIEIKFNTINYHDLKICISFLCGDPQIFCQSYGPLWLRRNQFDIGYMVCEREFFNTLHGIE